MMSNYVIALYVSFWSWNVHGSYSVCLPKPGVTQRLLQIKAAVQHEQHQLALSAYSRRWLLWAYKLLLVASLHDGACGRCAGRCSRQPWWRLTSAHGGTTSPSDGHQQRHWAAISKCQHGKCPTGDKLQLYGSGRREGTPLVIGKGALFSATTFRYWPPRGPSAGYCCDLF
jgi:hypothetical protein